MAMDGSAYMQTVMGILPLVLMVALLYFFMIRPQKKRDKEEREMRNSIQVGDEISTIGGFIGKVVSIKDDVLTIETSSDRTKLRIYRWAIRGKEAEPAEKVEAPKG
ncbi:MAG: preprotein translocase subunit YajC [Clostridiaceae bacterium]|nr:preprotein translocase subunit YajC [Clostridiaceae bacterium]NBI81047.1 preprotein translocase subunit YajC [Clostridiaceae bacterium]